MSPHTLKRLRLAFLLLGGLIALLGLTTLTLFALFPPPTASSDAIRGAVMYLFIAAICFYAARRPKPTQSASHAFEIPSTENPPSHP